MPCSQAHHWRNSLAWMLLSVRRHSWRYDSWQRVFLGGFLVSSSCVFSCWLEVLYLSSAFFSVCNSWRLCSRTDKQDSRWTCWIERIGLREAQKPRGLGPGHQGEKLISYYRICSVLFQYAWKLRFVMPGAAGAQVCSWLIRSITQGRLDAQNALKITDEEDPLHGYRVGDILRCEVLGLTISNNTLDLGMLGEKMCSTSSLPLKRIEVEELPETYVWAQYFSLKVPLANGNPVV
jgi:hypothetical protein